MKSKSNQIEQLDEISCGKLEKQYFQYNVTLEKHVEFENVEEEYEQSENEVVDKKQIQDDKSSIKKIPYIIHVRVSASYNEKKSHLFNMLPIRCFDVSIDKIELLAEWDKDSEMNEIGYGATIREESTTFISDGIMKYIRQEISTCNNKIETCFKIDEFYEGTVKDNITEFVQSFIAGCLSDFVLEYMNKTKFDKMFSKKKNPNVVIEKF